MPFSKTNQSTKQDFYVIFFFFSLDILTLNLRLLDVNPSPILHSAIFFCFRVILIRFSPRNMSIIWWLILIEFWCKFTGKKIKLHSLLWYIFWYPMLNFAQVTHYFWDGPNLRGPKEGKSFGLGKIDVSGLVPYSTLSWIYRSDFRNVIIRLSDERV